jgi:hypothetical protein
LTYKVIEEGGMNIFKVMASGRKSFSEETASAVLIWLLNPFMDHGLGYTFLNEFMERVFDKSNPKSELPSSLKDLSLNMRSDEDQNTRFWCDLELYVESATIDIVLGVDEWIFAIENKIYSKSFTPNQLNREYDGLKNNSGKVKNNKIGMIYLVPADGDDSPELKILEEFDTLKPKSGDFKSLITWQKNATYPSIANIIEAILSKESLGHIDPVPEQTRQTLKSLNAFIYKNFSGYNYDTPNSASSGQNPLTEDNRNLESLKGEPAGFVGVKNDIAGLLRMESTILKKYKFQYTSQDMTHKRNWIEINLFNKLAKWTLERDSANVKLPEIQWNGNYPSDILYLIAKSYGDKVYIGIRGGDEKLHSLSKDEITGKRWGISTSKNTNQWIPGSQFCAILERK